MINANDNLVHGKSQHDFGTIPQAGVTHVPDGPPSVSLDVTSATYPAGYVRRSSPGIEGYRRGLVLTKIQRHSIVCIGTLFRTLPNGPQLKLHNLRKRRTAASDMFLLCGIELETAI